MNAPHDRQLEINFDSDPEEEGYHQWREQRRAAMQKLARQMGLPLDHMVEVWLRGNIRLRGKLLLSEERLFIDEKADASLHLTVDGVPFHASEIESCVRLD